MAPHRLVSSAVVAILVPLERDWARRLSIWGAAVAVTMMLFHSMAEWAHFAEMIRALPLVVVASRPISHAPDIAVERRSPGRALAVAGKW